MSPKSWAAPTNSATTMAQKISHLLTVRAEGADPTPSPLTVSLTVKIPFFWRLPLESFWKLSVLNLIGFHYINVQGGLELGVPLSDGPCYERRWTGFYINCFFGGGITMMILDDLCRLYKANSFCWNSSSGANPFRKWVSMTITQPLMVASDMVMWWRDDDNK